MHGGVLMDHQPHLQTDMGFWYNLNVLMDKMTFNGTLMSFLSIRDVMLHDWFISWSVWSRPSYPWLCCLLMHVAENLMHRVQGADELLSPLCAQNRPQNTEEYTEKHFENEQELIWSIVLWMDYKNDRNLLPRGKDTTGTASAVKSLKWMVEIDWQRISEDKGMKKWGPSDLDAADSTVIGSERSKNINCRESYKKAKSSFIAQLMALRW